MGGRGRRRLPPGLSPPALRPRLRVAHAGLRRRAGRLVRLLRTRDRPLRRRLGAPALDARAHEGPHERPAAAEVRTRTPADRRRRLLTALDRRGARARLPRRRPPLSAIAAGDPPLSRADAERARRLWSRRRGLGGRPRRLRLKRNLLVPTGV